MAIAEELYPQEGSIAGAAPGGIPEVEERIAHRIAFFEEHAPIEVEVPAAVGPAERETYGWIDFGHLPNTRDLGGLAAAEGSRVKPGLLLRSGALGFGSDADLRRLRDEYHLMLVVDLRNDEELIEIPDPMDAFPGARYVHADILARSAKEYHAGRRPRARKSPASVVSSSARCAMTPMTAWKSCTATCL